MCRNQDSNPRPLTSKVAQWLSLESQGVSTLRMRRAATAGPGPERQHGRWLGGRGRGTGSPGRRVREGGAQRLPGQAASSHFKPTMWPAMPARPQESGISSESVFSRGVKNTYCQYNRSWSPGYLWITRLHYIKKQSQSLT